MEYGLIGERLSHSRSPMIHALFGDYRYETLELAPEALAGFLRERDFLGLNVTIPYKRAALALCDELSAEARALGNVNTLLVQDGRLLGHNTDLFGFECMARRLGVPILGRKAAVLGSGGAGLTAQAALERMGARQVLTVSRSGPLSYKALYDEHADTEILVNATPVGMYPGVGRAPVELSRLPKVQGVMDMIYNPLRSALILDAEARGIAHQDGLYMLVAQAARASALFTGEEVPKERMDGAYVSVRRALTNAVLIGMPGCGKSRVGARLAQEMGRALVDADERIEKAAGMKIPQIFEHFGEAHFRELEARAIAELGAKQGQVIATGGGAILREENVRALRQNGELLFLDRPLELLALDGRPLSKDRDALARMEAERRPLYERHAQRTIRNEGTLGEAVRAAKEAFYASVGD